MIQNCLKINLFNFKIYNIRKCSTIYALSTGFNNFKNKKDGVAIAIVRISGSQTRNILNNLTNGKIKKFIKNPRKAILTNIYDFETGEIIDNAISIWYPEPNSYTGEDMCEINLHGSKAIVSAVFKTISKIDDTRPAEYGEFTKKSFLNKKISLIEAEAIQSLIESSNECQRKNAIKALDGSIVKIYENWKNELIKFKAYLEAFIEFGEDQLLNEEKIHNTIPKLSNLRDEIEEHLFLSSKKHNLIKNGLSVVILGQPNVGKSSLMNKICNKELSIVSSYKGTTRDLIETSIDLNGLNVKMFDTAGIRDLKNSKNNFVEMEGIKRALISAKNADIILHLLDGSKIDLNILKKNYLQEKIQFYENDLEFLKKKIVMNVINKSDLLKISNKKLYEELSKDNSFTLISCKTNENFINLINRLSLNIEFLLNQNNTKINFDFITERHEAHLIRVVKNINSAIEMYNVDLSRASFFLNETILEIGFITGQISTEDILDVVFKNFCIGK